MGVDFVKSDSGKGRPKGNGSSQYDVEYSNPITEPDEVKPKHGNLLGALLGNTTSGRIPLPSTGAKPAPANMASAQSAHVTAAAVSRSVEYKPVAAGIMRATTATQSVSTTPKTPTPVTARLTDRHLPPPPPPPTHATKPAPTMTSTTIVTAPVIPAPVQPKPPVKPTITPTAPVITPVLHELPPAPPAPVHTVVVPTPTPTATATVAPIPAAAPVRATAPIKSAVAAAAPTAVGQHATSVGEIIARNVTNLHGESTHPDALTPQIVGVNLLPNAIQQPLQQQLPLYRLLRTSSLLVSLFALLYLGMVGYQAFYIWRTQATLSELTELDRQILTYRSLQEDINATSATLGSIQDLLTQHIYWSQWFSYLEEHTLPTVYYTGFSGSANGTMNLQAVAPDFLTISQQIAAWRALPEVMDVTVSTATRSETSFTETTGDAASVVAGTVVFNISLQVNPSILHYE